MSPIEIRDRREQDWFWCSNLFLDLYAEFLGSNCVSVYAVLCRFSNNSTQECFPSMDTIAKKSGLKSRKTVSKAISDLETHKIITIEKRADNEGKRMSNIYRLNSPKDWLSVSGIPVVVSAKTPKQEKPKAAATAEGNVLELPEWLDKKAWAEWVAYKKERKQKLPQSTIDYQLKQLAKDIPNHAAMIRQSISRGWTGFFPLKGDFIQANKQTAPAGKYAKVS